MTKSKDLLGRRVSREEVLRELGDPSTWEAQARELARRQAEPYERQPVTFTVSRVSYFDDPDGGSLRWEEVSPDDPHAHDDHAVCGCTRNVGERPKGEPHQRQFNLSVKEEGVYKTEYAILPSNWFVFENWAKRPHGYFRFLLDQKAISIEISRGEEKEGIEDSETFFKTTFFAHLYWGNKIDVSTLFNGHSPSKIINLSEISPDQVWLHSCTWGHEQIRFLTDPVEVGLWKEAITIANIIWTAVVSTEKDYVTPVEAIRRNLETDHALVDACTSLRELLTPLYRDFEKTELFSKVSEIATADRLDAERQRSGRKR